MSKKNHSGNKGIDGSRTKNKGESQKGKQQGAESVSKKNAGKHTKDESHGAEHNTTKKQQNSI